MTNKEEEAVPDHERVLGFWSLVFLSYFWVCNHANQRHRVRFRCVVSTTYCVTLAVD